MRQLINNRLTRVSCLFILSFSLALSTYAQDLSKYHALFIGKFIDYIEWPKGAGTITIGVVGDSKVYEELMASVGQRGKATIKKISGGTDATDCQVIFIPSSQSRLFESIKSATTGKGILLVTENEQFARKGAAISFYLEDGKLRFMLNESAAKSHDLKISSGLLSLARVI